MYAKILVLLVLAILCTGCTDPDLPDPYEFENVTPGAPALQKSWDAETQTITISTLDDTPGLTIRKISAVPDLCTFEEVLEIESFVDYDLNKLKDFRTRWKKHKGQHDISKVEWFILNNESYSVTVDDYEIIQVEETHYNNVTKVYYNVTVNQTVLVDNHSEVRYHDIWKPFSPVGKSIHAGQTYTVKIVYHKPPELGAVRIQTIPMFAGIECEELTWWNTSWGYKIDSIVADVAFPHQLNLTVYGGTGTNNATNVFLNGHNNTDFSDIRFVLDDATELAHWIGNNTTDPIKVWINVTANGTVSLYYGNPSVEDASNRGAFIDYSSDLSTQVQAISSGDLTGLPGQKEGAFDNVLVSSQSVNDQWFSETVVGSGVWIGQNFGSVTDIVRYGVYVDINAATSMTAVRIPYTWRFDGSNSATFDTYTTLDTQTAYTLSDAIWSTFDLDTAGDYQYYRMFITAVGTGTDNYAFVTEMELKTFYTADPAPTWGTWGSEQTVPIISAYTPSTPLSKTTSDSQLFTVNTSENSQCRWYINGSLKQTNSTGATRHEYTNSSLDEGYWNFTATANTTDQTSSQTWWVTVTSADEFEQDMYASRWMYITNLNSTNLNLSQFFTLLNPYYLSCYNATDQKTYNYKSGRWEKYTAKEIKSGEAAMLRYTSNVTKVRTNASGAFGLTLRTGLNHIGHSHNGTRNLTWYNTTIASANLVTIEHQNPENGTISTFTYGSAANGTVEVLQGFGVEVNVSSDAVISGL